MSCLSFAMESNWLRVSCSNSRCRRNAFSTASASVRSAAGSTSPFCLRSTVRHENTHTHPLDTITHGHENAQAQYRSCEHTHAHTHTRTHTHTHAHTQHTQCTHTRTQLAHAVNVICRAVNEATTTAPLAHPPVSTHAARPVSADTYAGSAAVARSIDWPDQPQLVRIAASPPPRPHAPPPADRTVDGPFPAHVALPSTGQAGTADQSTTHSHPAHIASVDHTCPTNHTNHIDHYCKAH